jgi:hypothetical protein
MDHLHLPNRRLSGVSGGRGATDNAVLSPDGRTSARAARDEGEAVIDLVDLEAQQERRLWSGDSYVANLSQSPDGRLLAISCYVKDSDDEDGTPETAVLEVASGATLARYRRLETLAATNGAWIGDRELVVFDDESVPDEPIMVANVDTREIRRYGHWPAQWSGECLSIFRGRLIQKIYGKGFYTTGLDGSDPQPFMTAPENLNLRGFEVAPQAAAR